MLNKRRYYKSKLIILLFILIYPIQYLIEAHLLFLDRINQAMVFEFVVQQGYLFFLQKYFLLLQFLQPAHKHLAEKDQDLNHCLKQ